MAAIAPGTLLVTVDDDGRTRVRERYTISAPIQGRLLRIRLDPEVIPGNLDGSKPEEPEEGSG